MHKKRATRPTPQTLKPMHDGDMSYQVYARKALPILVQQVKFKKPITYGELALELGMHHRSLRHVLGCVGISIERLEEGRTKSEKWKENIPKINTLVVNKTTELPGTGIGEFFGQDFTKLPKYTRELIQEEALSKIYQYPYWDKVLEALKLEPAKNFASLLKNTYRASTGGGFGGGEGKAHENLRKHVATHPEILGLPKRLIGDMKRVLASGDKPDVSFLIDAGSRYEWVAVEIKSAISPESDITRGIFQCIKYKAVMEAEALSGGKPPNIRAVLVLEGEFPPSLREYKHRLRVEVIDNISPG